MFDPKDIDKIEVRDRFGGGKVVDVIFTDGHKRKFDPQALRKRKKRLEAKKTATQKELDVYDGLVTFAEEQINPPTKKKKS